MKDILEIYNRKIMEFDYSTLPDGLITGKLGLVLYFVSVYNSRREVVYVEHAKDLLERVFVNANSQNGDNVYLHSSLSKGLAGMVYVLQIMLHDDLLEKDVKNLINEMCDIILERSIKMLHEENFTFLDGPIGSVFLLNFINDNAKAGLLIELLYAVCKEKEYPFYTKLNDSYTDGINFGMNYGYLSVINSLLPHLSKNTNADYIVNRCLQIIDINLNQSYIVSGANIYKPHNLTYDNNELVPYQNNRLCWCNSDISYSYILYKIARQFPEMNTKNLAEMLGNATVKRTAFENTGIQFAQFCHGSAGLSKLYSELADMNSFYQISEKYWTTRTLEYLDHDKYSPLSKNDFSLLFGKIGALMVIDDSIDSSKYLKFLL